MNNTCTGACGWMSRKARTSSSSYTTSAGISRRMILSKMVSGMAGASRVRDLGLGTWDLGLGTWDLGLGTWDLGLGTRDSGLGTRDSGLGTRHSALGTRDLGLGNSITTVPSPPSPRPSILENLPAAERVGQRAAIDVFEFAAERYAMREPRGTHAGRSRQLAEPVRRCFTFHRRIGGDHQFAHLAGRERTRQKLRSEFVGAETIQRRESPHQYEIAPAVTGRLLDCEQVGGCLDHADLRCVPRRACADRALLGFAEIAAGLAVPDALHRLREYGSQTRTAIAVALQQMEGHPLGAF